MRYITEDDLNIFEKERGLSKKTREAKECWLKEVEKSHQGLIEYDDAEPLFNEYLKAHNEWKEYFDANITILLAQKI